MDRYAVPQALTPAVAELMFMETDPKIRRLEKTLGYTFADPALLQRALTRPAYAREQGLPEDRHQEALATLGDAVIDLIVIQSIMERGVSKKGEITAEKMMVVSLLPLNEIGKALRLQEYTQFGKGEAKQEIWKYSDALTETLEAVIGAIYLDSGMISTAERVMRSLRCIP